MLLTMLDFSISVGLVLVYYNIDALKATEFRLEVQIQGRLVFVF